MTDLQGDEPMRRDGEGDPTDPSDGTAATTGAAALLAQAGRLLLEYNESTAEIHRALAMTGASLTSEPCDVAVGYDGVTVSFAGEPAAIRTVNNLHFNTALQAQVYPFLVRVRAGELPPTGALRRLATIEADTPRHPIWIALSILGIGAGSLAVLLEADAPAALVAGASSALGLVARKALGRRGFGPLALPFAAALIGALIDGLAVRSGWTTTPGLTLIVPALMAVPGPHLINGLSDLIDNVALTGIARLGLAAALLCAATFGSVLGIKQILSPDSVGRAAGGADQLSLAAVLGLAGLVTISFAVFYNAAWPQVVLAAVGSMAGNGLRDAALDAGYRLDAGTFQGGLAVGVTAALIARHYRNPFAVIAFAEAVTMMPGVHICRALFAALRLARPGTLHGQSEAAELARNCSKSAL